MAVISKKDEKVSSVLKEMKDMNDIQEFKDKFKEMYPKDWAHICAVYNKEERHDKKHKGHPMPEPDKYLENAFKVFNHKSITK